MGGKDSGGGGDDMAIMQQIASNMNDNAAGVQDDYMAQVAEMMGGLMAAMSESMMAMQANQPKIPNMPHAESTPTIDWQDKMDQLQNKMRADYTTETDKKKGRSSTIHTSPLLLEEEPSITNKGLLGSGTLVTK